MGTFPLKIAAQMIERFEYHLGAPGQTAEEYRLAKTLGRAQRALRVPRLYIDTNYWVRLRDVSLGRPRSDEDRELLDALRLASSEGRLVVPLTCHLVEELCHQASLTTRRATAEVMDEVSNGVTLASFPERDNLEVLSWIGAIRGTCPPLPLINVWTTVVNIFQPLSAQLNDPDPQVREASAKAYEDVCGTVRLCDLIDSLGRTPRDPDAARAFAAELTGYKSTAWKDQGRLNDVFLEEAIGYLDKVLPLLTGDLAEELKKLPLAQGLVGADLIWNAKRVFLATNALGELPTALPSLRIRAGCYAAIRVDRPRHFKPGDALDLDHASAALPYCSAFLTDGALSHLLSSPPQHLATRYECEVFSTAGEAIRYVGRQVIREPGADSKGSPFTQVVEGSSGSVAK